MYFNYAIASVSNNIFLINYNYCTLSDDLDGTIEIDLNTKKVSLIKRSKTEDGSFSYLRMATTIMNNPKKLNIPIGKKGIVAYG